MSQKGIPYKRSFKSKIPPPGYFDDANCKDLDTDDFYPDPRLRVSRDLTIVRKICNECEIKLRCLDWALTTNEEWGVWGGMTRVERELFKEMNH